MIFLDFAKINFNCPNCGKEYSDENGIYLNRINRNQSGTTKIRCTCGCKFGMTYDYRNQAVTFFIRASKLNMPVSSDCP